MTNERITNNNAVWMIGEVLEDLSFTHSMYGEKFYTTKIGIKRISGVYDNIPIIISERITNVKNIECGGFIEILGEYRSHNTPDGKLELFAFVQKLNILNEERHENEVMLKGYVCKEPLYRITPMGRKITDVFLAVNRQLYNKSDYIPIIFWGRNAEYISNFKVGEMIQVFGRVQERSYLKCFEDGTTEERTAYEVSAYKFYENEEKDI